ncbi:MAG TPA: protein kinase [Vicinamibacteria bacterium]|nr:protein kinase [Vicinamibacteria bacterium]
MGRSTLLYDEMTIGTETTKVGTAAPPAEGTPPASQVATLPMDGPREEEEPRKGIRLATRLSLTIAVLLASCLSLALAFATWRANQVTGERIHQNLKVVPALYSSFAGSEASARRQQVKSSAEQPGTRALLAEVRAGVETFHDSARDFARDLGAEIVFFFDSRGALLARSDRTAGEESGRDFSAVAWVKGPLSDLTESSAFILDVKRKKALFLVAAAPVTQGEGRELKVNGVLAAAFPVGDARATELGHLMSGEIAFVANLAARGASPETAVVAATAPLRGLAFQGILASTGALEPIFGRGEPFGPLEFSSRDEGYIATALPIKSGSGEVIAALVVARSKDVELAAFRQIRRGIAWIGALVLLASLPISSALARRISHPIEQLAVGAEAIRGGQLDIALPRARGDEVGTLARAFAAMVAELKQKAALEKWVAEVLRRPGDVTLGSRAVVGEEQAPPGLGIDKLFAKRYYVLSVLGEGGMGRVYRAHDRDLDEQVALKVLTRSSFGEGTQADEVLKQETRLARMITHPNVVRVYDLGESEGSRFLTMEYVPGTTLSELLDRRGKLDLAPGLQIAKQICRGLAAVHNANVVHGDLKPRNVMVMANGVVKLMDFGVARGSRIGENKEGILAGSVQYMSPEQARGAVLDARSDLYSAGVSLFEMFTGQRPFESEDRDTLLRMHLHDPPRDPRTLRPELPDALCHAILACLAKSRVQRPATASDLERALLRVKI